MATAGLEYPFEKPERGTVTEVVPGVLWVRMPLPFRLDHVNLWLIRDGDGWAVVDTGMRNETVEATWEGILESVLGGSRVTKVIATHMHADHVGMAGWLTARFGCELWMTAHEYHGCKEALRPEVEPPPAKVAFYQRAGWSPEALENFRTTYNGFGGAVHPLPTAFRQMVDGERIILGDHEWQVVVGTGHTSEHACLYCPQLRLFISGDQVLPKITSNVSVPSLQPDANPMEGWLSTLIKIKRKVGNDVLVLPAHNECFRGLHARLDDLLQLQHRLLADLLLELQKPRRAVDVFECLFSRPITMSDGFLLTMATGESLANLNYLIASGKAVKRQDTAGVDWYSSTST
ncbi:MBL fold metallo-hydrolase [Pseudomonas aeruginosa]|nr:MBL fold metallo-hydrolase [Pseudomonas aeruginosa]QII97883.1 MBL fold metallo-hydrolase [Pseudomonas aeruginosa]WCV63932.1 MBL fold metallo-hydrolase [Pseudomonas aeruginosa]HBO4051714.1 MBL fold metallo-hydrolase [Pseudomonas aeruginosa]HBO4367869.1 MBL fold metallo-hydrolase [Pseudomonas aeruginosa]